MKKHKILPELLYHIANMHECTLKDFTVLFCICELPYRSNENATEKEVLNYILQYTSHMPLYGDQQSALKDMVEEYLKGDWDHEETK